MYTLHKKITYLLLATAIASAEDSHNIGKTFLSLSVGSSSFNVEANLRRNVILEDQALDNSGVLFDIGLGYRVSPNIFYTVGYQNVSLDITKVDHIYGTINYQFSDTVLHPYIGGILGYGTLTWDRAPSVVRYNKLLNEKSTTYGVQVGIEEHINEKVSFFASYQVNFADFTLEMYKNTSNIKHKQFNNALIGVKYDF